MIRFIGDEDVARGSEEEQQPDVEKKQEGQALISNTSKCAREESEAGALGGNEEIMDA